MARCKDIRSLEHIDSLPKIWMKMVTRALRHCLYINHLSQFYPRNSNFWRLWICSKDIIFLLAMIFVTFLSSLNRTYYQVHKEVLTKVKVILFSWQLFPTITFNTIVFTITKYITRFVNPHNNIKYSNSSSIEGKTYW